MSWALAGTYLEACNCDVICPCRTVGEVKGGRSTYGVCVGVLSWLVEEGQADGIDLGSLAVAMTYHYDDDEPGSPWTLALHVDEAASDEAHAALVDVFLGRRGGHLAKLPWNRKPSVVTKVQRSRIELDHVSERRFLRVAESAVLTISHPVETDELVTCGIPGHHQHGRELVADRLEVRDAPYAAAFSGRCGYTSRFAYGSGD